MIRLQDIKMKIVSTNKADMNFKMNFIALLINSIIESSSSGKANTNPLNYITSNTKIENIHWCSYLIDCLVKNKQSFDPSNQTSNFNGPSAYLVLLYLDRIKSDVLKVERTRPVICHWTSEKIKMRETFEKEELGDFGTRDFNDEYVDEELNQKAYEQLVTNKHTELDILIEYGMKKFPENITLNHLKIRYNAIFKDKSEDNQETNGNDHVQHENIEGDADKDQNDNNDKGFYDANLHDEVLDNEKDGNNNAEGEDLEVMNIEGKDAKKVEGTTGEQQQRDGEGKEEENVQERVITCYSQQTKEWHSDMYLKACFPENIYFRCHRLMV
ncbi:unnamed protein product [Lactuca saligna]|uniref:Uncharacterized protein n=1 Tax=Lactuca saligna TaxID=75948 RepID=A0AA35Y7L8_LACSI|nr:unnamed protein product [Lactuca saligna]